MTCALTNRYLGKCGCICWKCCISRILAVSAATRTRFLISFYIHLFVVHLFAIMNTRRTSSQRGAARKGPSGDYEDVPRVVVVMLLDGNMMFPGSAQVVTACRMAWDVDGQGRPGPDNITIVIAELDKVRGRYNEGGIGEMLADESLAWLYLLAAGYEHPEEVELIMSSFPTME